MKHYICRGECGGVSDTPGVCEAEQCTMRGEPLKECACPDKYNHKKTKQE